MSIILRETGFLRICSGSCPAAERGMEVNMAGRILNFGSLNIDRVYRVEHFVRPGETVASKGYQCFPGGKGLNQSIAAARAGARVFHAGTVGADGDFLI